MVQFVDSHAHITSEAVFPIAEEVLARAGEAGIKAIVNIATDPGSLHKGIALSKKFPWLYNAAATTPHDVDKEGQAHFAAIEESARNGTLVAIGETGLDYYYKHSSPEAQRKFCIKYLKLALECRLPVIIHCREAFKDLFEILDAYYINDSRAVAGILHCFTGTLEEAKEVISRGWYLSLSGIITFKKSEALRETAKWAPLDQLLIETDTPYLAPQRHRGKPNEPCFLPEVAEEIARVKGIALQDVAEATLNNAKAVFKL